jgi:hypothetical protein
MSSDILTGIAIGIVISSIAGGIGAEFRSRYRIVRRKDDADA